MRAESNDAPRELVHDQQNPISAPDCGFAVEQVAALRAVLYVAQKREPGGTVSIRLRPIMRAQDAASDVLVHVRAES